MAANCEQPDKEHEEEEEEEDWETLEEGPLTHKVAMHRFKDSLAELIVGDPHLSDLPTAVTLEEVKSQIALEHGQAMNVKVIRADGEELSVVVVRNATVLDLKKAIKRHFTLRLSRQHQQFTKAISWKYIWKRYWLYFDGQKLKDDTKLLKDYGVQNKDEVTFIKRLRQR